MWVKKLHEHGTIPRRYVTIRQSGVIYEGIRPRGITPLK